MFHLLMFAFVIYLQFKPCMGQHECTDDDNAPNNVRVINDTSVEVSFSENTTNISKIEYWHIRNLGCSNVAPMKKKRNITQSHIINGLFPFSLYGIVIKYYKNGVECIKEATFNTTESADLSNQEKPTISHTLNATEVTVSIKWKCEDLRGPILHDISVACISLDCATQFINYDETETISTMDIKFKITKYRIYRVKLTYSRGTESRFEQYDVIMHTQEPPMIGDIITYNINDTSVSLKWSPPTRDVELYEILYYSTDEVKMLNISGSSYCEIWQDYVCVTINGRNFLSEPYIFEVRSKRYLVDQYARAKIYHINPDIKIEPSPPLNPNYAWNDEQNLRIEWQHPDIPNGRILRFYIDINNKLILTYNVTKESQDYSYDINTSNFALTTKNLLIEISAANERGNSSKSSNWHRRPHFSTSPIIENETGSQCDIRIPTISDIAGDTSKMYIIVTDTESPTSNGNLHPRELELFRKIDAEEDYSWTIGEFDLGNITQITIGDSLISASELDSSWIFNNSVLERDHLYNVTVVLNDTFFGSTKIETYYLSCKTTAMGSLVTYLTPSDDEDDYLWSLLILPVLLGLVGTVIIKRKQKTPLIKIISCGIFGRSKRHPQHSLPLLPLNNNTYDKIVLNDGDFKKMVKIQQLDRYIKNSIENDELSKQYNLLPQRPIKLHNDGSQLPNRAKNRHPALVAYDANRVKLDVIEGDEFSDYINASYINGYNKQKAYIATQTPTDNTYDDFWRMIWQEDVKYIIVAADLNEHEQEKGSGIYWPKINNHLNFGNIKILCKKVEAMANYEIRQFKLFCGKKEKSVEQLHFFSIPEYSRVPLYIHSLASFIKKILSIPEDNSPIVVHCNDGMSYTGMMILCNICLKMAISEGQVDVLYQLLKLRKQRMNMISCVEEYIVVHFVLLRILERLKTAAETSITCDKNMEDAIENILTTKITKQIKYLEESSWQDEAMRDIDFLYECIGINKAYEPDESHSKACRYSTVGNEFITTTIVDSLLTPSKFIVTPNPLLSTLGVFWRFIFEKHIQVIVCLNELSIITDLEKTFNPSLTLEVTCVDHILNEYFEVYTLYANETYNKDDKIEVHIIHILGWPPDLIHPEHPNSLIMAYEEMNRLEQSGKSILITCLDGIHACGLFVALSFLIEKIRTERVCDVCLAVKSVRQSRKEYVHEEEQFRFLYLCALQYVYLFKNNLDFE